ncbi:MAG: Eco57I restriction-modification methylase domain-containing protein, partial [Anaerolineae bacterium]
GDGTSRGDGTSPIDDATILARLVAQKCVFGVAEDATDVEVAQTALWLHTFARAAPVSFLGHHLRRGNALLGMELSGAARDSGRTGLGDEVASVVARGLYPVVERVDRTPLDVRWSAAQSQRTDEVVAPHKLLLDLLVSAALGDTEARAALSALEEASDLETLGSLAPAWLAAQAEAEGFFHWEIEFPELFVDLATEELRDDPGVDVVIGNPPWLPAQEEVLARFYADRFGSAVETDDPGCDRFNPHHAYLALARWLTRASGGRTAYVLSRAWLAKRIGGI